jgi:class 3 adenylate cyclase
MAIDPVSSSVISDGSGQCGGQSEAREGAQGRGALAASATAERAPDPIAVALASALAEAARAARWDIVAQLAKELEARRL